MAESLRNRRRFFRAASPGHSASHFYSGRNCADEFPRFQHCHGLRLSNLVLRPRVSRRAGLSKRAAAVVESGSDAAFNQGAIALDYPARYRFCVSLSPDFETEPTGAHLIGGTRLETNGGVPKTDTSVMP